MKFGLDLRFGVSVSKCARYPDFAVSLGFLGSNSYTVVKLWVISNDLPICTSNEDGRNFVIKGFGRVINEVKRMV